jgi:membrane-associated HD superfamily phosphohydrolase
MEGNRMSDEQFMREPPKNRVQAILGYVAVAVVMFGVGMLVESRLAAQTAAAVKTAHEQDLKQAADKADQQKRTAEEQKQALTDELTKEREQNAKTVQAKDKSLASVTSHAAGVRHALETDLSAARASGEACTARIAGISEAVNGVFDSVGEVTGIAQDLGRENEQLKADNKSLSEKLVGWQKWNTERGQRVTVIGQKNG